MLQVWERWEKPLERHGPDEDAKVWKHAWKDGGGQQEGCDGRTCQHWQEENIMSIGILLHAFVHWTHPMVQPSNLRRYAPTIMQSLGETCYAIRNQEIENGGMCE